MEKTNPKNTPTKGQTNLSPCQPAERIYRPKLPPPNPPNQKHSYRTHKLHINTAQYTAFPSAVYVCSINVQKNFIAQLLRSRSIAPKYRHRQGQGFALSPRGETLV
jgi:hypothetical protein